MRIYQGTVSSFKEDVVNNVIADKLSEIFHYNKIAFDTPEYNSWNVSLRVLKDALDDTELRENRIIVEYRLPYSDRRIDVLLFGQGQDKVDKVVLVELKQWSNEKVHDCEIEGNVVVDYGRVKTQRAHPSLQVEGYVLDLKDFMKVFTAKPAVDLEGCAYCHNYARSGDGVLFAEKFSKAIEKYPLFSKEEAKAFGQYLKNKLSSDPGLEVFNRFVVSSIGPSKMLLDHTSEMINKQQIFHLIDDQIAAYNAIMDRAKKQSKLGRKSVIIVKGGPGTGKSVIALEVMGELLRLGKTVFHATGSSAFTNTLRDIIGKERRSAKAFFKFFFAFTKTQDNKIDVIICDEAHRIRKDSNDYGVHRAFKSKAPQVDDLIRPAKLAVFFIDERQAVRPNEIGNIELIRSAAGKLGVEERDIYEFELKTQFRCSGSDAYLQWVENTLQVRETEVKELSRSVKMDFQILDSPQKLYEKIKEKNIEKPNCARIVAGFCWPWSKPLPSGELIKDVKIGDFEMPWEKKDEFWKWATHTSGMEQVGTVYTSQGFEFDYIGVIFGNDLVYRKDEKKWAAIPENSFDGTVKRGKESFAEHLKNVYRVLLSRAHKGCYVYFMDKETEEFFKSCIEPEMVAVQERPRLRILERVVDTQKYTECLPVYSLQAAAGYFGHGEEVTESGWVKADIGRKLDRLMFVAKVVGRSMEPMIPDGSWCVFRANPGGSRQGKIVLVQHHSIDDPDTGGKYTIKKYMSKKRENEHSNLEHEEIVLQPLNSDYKPIVIQNADDGEFQVIAEFVAALF